MAYQRGDVVLVPFPFSDLQSSKIRPAVVVSGSAYHNTEPDILIGAITSNVAAAISPVDYVLADWQQANLRMPSAFKPVLATIDPALVQLKVGRLSPGDLAAVDGCLRLMLSL